MYKVIILDKNIKKKYIKEKNNIEKNNIDNSSNTKIEKNKDYFVNNEDFYEK